jgi:Uma2 family endonuclease
VHCNCAQAFLFLIMKVEEPDLTGSYNYANYLTWQWDEMVELIHGKIYKMSPAPGSKHQKVSGNLSGLLWQYLRGKRCQVFTAPFDVRLPSKENKEEDKEIINVVQPDLCVIDERGCIGAPDWIIEILSPHTNTKDLREKFDLYEEAGVREYWAIHPHDETVLVYTLNDNGKYQGILKPYIRTDKITSLALPGLIVDLEEVFPNS